MASPTTVFIDLPTAGAVVQGTDTTQFRSIAVYPFKDVKTGIDEDAIVWIHFENDSGSHCVPLYPGSLPISFTSWGIKTSDLYFESTKNSQGVLCVCMS